MQSTMMKGTGIRAARHAHTCGRPGRRGLVIMNDYQREQQLFGEDFGARDPTRGEIETNFSDKVWFNWNTEHIIKPPETMKRVLGLSSKTCYPAAEVAQLEEGEINRLKFQVLGWRVEKVEGGVFTLVQDYKVKDKASGATLMERFANVDREQGHAPAAVTQPEDTAVRVTMRTTANGIDGLTVNDFILSMKYNDVPLSDLAPPKRKRYWA